MNNGKLICRVCGKEYDPCRTSSSSGGAFRWQDVACSKEHGAVYLARIEESRSPKKKRFRPEIISTPPTEEENKIVSPAEAEVSDEEQE